ncbi:MAG: hypothetical protein ACXVRK_08935, partial [Gaiellaceae bacterium]
MGRGDPAWVRNVSAEEGDAAMPDYRYELRRGDQVIATGHLTREQPLEVGDRISDRGRSPIRNGLRRRVEHLWSAQFDPLSNTEGVAPGARMTSASAGRMEHLWSGRVDLLLHGEGVFEQAGSGGSYLTSPGGCGRVTASKPGDCASGSRASAFLVRGLPYRSL